MSCREKVKVRRAEKLRTDMALQPPLLAAAAALPSAPIFVRATASKLCGPECGPLFADYPHNDSCRRPDTQSYFSFDLQPHYM